MSFPDPNLISVLTNIIGGVAANGIYDYLKSTPNPTQEGIINILAKNYGSEITVENVSMVANKILNIVAEDGGKISLGEGEYKSKGATIRIGKGAGIRMSGNSGIKMN